MRTTLSTLSRRDSVALGVRGLLRWMLLRALWGVVLLAIVWPGGIHAQVSGPGTLQTRLDGEVLTVFGRIFEEDGITPWARADTVLVQNRRTHGQLSSVFGTLEPGWFAVSYVDVSGEGAIAEGDTLDFGLLRWRLKEPTTAILRIEDLDARLLRHDLRVGSLVQTGACCTGGADCTIMIEAYCWDGIYNGTAQSCVSDPCGPSSDIDDLGPFGHTNIEWIRPNPFRRTATIRLHAGLRESSTLIVVDAAGRKIRNLFGGLGVRLVTWDGRNDRGLRVPSGIYFVRLSFAGGESSLPVVLIQ